MKSRIATIVVALMLLSGCIYGAQTTPAPSSPGPTQALPSSLKIVSPKNGEKISTSFVDVQLNLANPGASAETPTFQYTLDGRDPVQSTDLSHTFTGLTPGAHTLTVELVDANGTPITGSRNAVQFTVLPGTGSGQAPQPRSAPSPANSPDTWKTQNSPRVLDRVSGHEARGGLLVPAFYLQQAPAPAAPAGKNLPRTGSELPLLSVIGFGALLGGLASVLRTR